MGVNLQTVSSIKSNIWKLYILKGLEFAWFPIPVIILFYENNGLSFEQSLLLKTILSLSIFIFEIPSGYFADIFGRKACLVSGGLVWTLGLLFYCFQTSFSAFAIAEILSGLAMSLISGANTALGFDSLVKMNQEQNYRHVEGRLGAIAGVAEAICGLVGGLVAARNLVYPFYLQTICIFVYFLIALTLVEPNLDQSSTNASQPDNHREIWEAIRFSLLVNKKVKWLILFSANFGIATFLAVWLSQADMQSRGLEVSSFGFAWAAFHLIMSFASFKATSIENFWGTKKVFLGLVIFLGLSYICLGLINQVWGIIFIALIYFSRGVRSPLVLNCINQNLPSSIRATVLSINSFMFNLGFIAIAPVVGWITETYNLDTALFLLGFVFIGFGVFCWQKLVESEVF
ncbi:MFS transporter [Calothrix sp. CCY 0018]|uniref:MFS transporter n=1 Tax=Calothrix sp. CCY 0018 TaxID=3103864 RepID=UPI0039C740EE